MGRVYVLEPLSTRDKASYEGLCQERHPFAPNDDRISIFKLTMHPSTCISPLHKGRVLLTSNFLIHLIHISHLSDNEFIKRASLS